MHNAVAAIQDAVKDAFVNKNIAKISDGGNDVMVAILLLEVFVNRSSSRSQQ